MWPRGFLVLLALLATLGQPSGSAAQEEQASVRVDGSTVLRLGEGEGMNAVERARRAERRLERLLDRPEALMPVRVEARGEERVLAVSTLELLTVLPSDAAEELVSVDALAARWSTALQAALERAALRRATPVRRFAAEVRASVRSAFSRLQESAITVIPRLLAAVLVLGFFWLLASGVRGALRLLFRWWRADPTGANLAKQVGYYATWGVGLAVASDALGFDPAAVAAGLGLTGLVLGFALKDVLSHFVAGVLTLLLRPFEIGDEIVVGDTEGRVERITLRATEIRAYDGRIVLVPNADVFTSRVVNNTACPRRRGSVTLFLGYDSDLRIAQEAALLAVQRVEGVLTDPAPTVRLRDLSQEDLVFEVRFWCDSRRSDFVATASVVREAIVSGLRQAGVPLPQPDARVVTLRSP